MEDLTSISYCSEIVLKQDSDNLAIICNGVYPTCACNIKVCDGGGRGIGRRTVRSLRCSGTVGLSGSLLRSGVSSGEFALVPHASGGESRDPNPLTPSIGETEANDAQ